MDKRERHVDVPIRFVIRRPGRLTYVCLPFRDRILRLMVDVTLVLDLIGPRNLLNTPLRRTLHLLVLNVDLGPSFPQ